VLMQDLTLIPPLSRRPLVWERSDCELRTECAEQCGETLHLTRCRVRAWAFDSLQLLTKVVLWTYCSPYGLSQVHYH
jgi:predicted nucleic acid-binding Zn ribbon protein